jgi:hypothetical protein
MPSRKQWLLKNLYSTHRLTTPLTGTGIVQSDFYEVIQDAKAKAVLGNNPHRLAYDLAMIQCAWAMKELGDGESHHCVSFICDEEKEHSDVAEPAFNTLKETNPVAAKFMATFSMANEKQCLAVQMRMPWFMRFDVH